MVESKYGKYIFTEPIQMENAAKMESPAYAVECVKATQDLMQTDCRICFNPIIHPYLMEAQPMVHDFHQFLCFIGSDPMNIRDFGAEIELYLGEEGEKHIINHTTVVHIPPGLVHCPLRFKKVDKPVIFMDIVLTPKYEKKLVTGANPSQ